MEFYKAFPIAIIDEDYEGKHAAGRGMRQLAEAIEKEGFRVVAGVSYEDAQRLVEVFNSESCWLVSVDGAEAGPPQWEILEEVLAAKRRRNDRLPIFLLRRRAHGGDGAGERAEARQRLHAPVRGLAGVPRARHRPRGAALPRPPAAADVQGADGLHAARPATPGTPRATAAASRSARARSASCSTSSSARTRCAPTSPSRSARSARCSTTPARSPRASATPRASSAPTRRCSSSAAPPPRTRSSGTAWSAAATSCCATATATSRSCTR